MHNPPADMLPHPLNPRREAVVEHDGAAVLESRQALRAARHRHGAARLGARVRPVVRVAYRVDALGAERANALQRLLLLYAVQADGAVFRALTHLTGVRHQYYIIVNSSSINTREVVCFLQPRDYVCGRPEIM